MAQRLPWHLFNKFTVRASFMIFKRFPTSEAMKKITIYEHFTPAVTIQSPIIVYSFTVVCRSFCIADEGSEGKKYSTKITGAFNHRYWDLCRDQRARLHVELRRPNVMIRSNFGSDTVLYGHLFCGRADARVKRFSILSLFWKFFYLMHYLLFPLLRLFICLLRGAICWCWGLEGVSQ